MGEFDTAQEAYIIIIIGRGSRRVSSIDDGAVIIIFPVEKSFKKTGEGDANIKGPDPSFGLSLHVALGPRSPHLSVHLLG